MTILLTLLRRYWLHMAVLAIVAVLSAWAYSWAYGNGVAAERALWLARENQALTQAVAERDRALADRNAAQRKADELAKLPAKVVTVVRRNPSNCALPRTVTDSVRDQVRETNSAIRAMR